MRATDATAPFGRGDSSAAGSGCLARWARPRSSSELSGRRAAAASAGAAILVLSLLGTALVVDHQRLDSLTTDEAVHATASAEYVLHGTCFTNLEHPPLAKLLAGLSLRAAGARPSAMPKPFSYATAETPTSFVFRNAIPSEALVAAARRPFPLLFLVLVSLSASFAWRLAGPMAGVLTAAILAFEPTLVAHAAYVHTDVLFALASVAVCFATALAARRPTAGRWLLVGVALGGALAGKFSAVILVPVVLLAGLTAQLDALRQGRTGLTHLRGLVLAGVSALAVLLGVYSAAMRRMSPDEVETAVRTYLTWRQLPRPAIERQVFVSRVSAPLGHFAAGLLGVVAQNEAGGGVNVLCGRLSVEGFVGYFPVAFLVKSSLGYLGLLAIGALALGTSSRRARREGGALVPSAADLALLAAPALLLFVQGAGSSYNIGVRHMAPAYPLLAIASVSILVRAWPSARAIAAVMALAGLQLLETVAVHPHEISFFNAAAGGPIRGAEWLADSNLDWGQDLRRLSLELRRRRYSGPVTVAYAGGGYPPVDCPEARMFNPETMRPGPGVWVVSQQLLQAGPELLRFKGQERAAEGVERLRSAVLTRGEPLGRVGYSLLFFRLPPEVRD